MKEEVIKAPTYYREYGCATNAQLNRAPALAVSFFRYVA
jgi:hypothetical protein